MQQKTLFKNTFYKSLLNIMNIVVPLIIGPYIVRLLDVELYGIYNKVYSEFQIFLTFASFGIYTYGIKEVSKIRDNPKATAKLFSNLFIISIFTNLISTILYLIFGLGIFGATGITKIIYIVMVLQIVGNIFYIEYVNEALENYKFITIKSIVIKLFYLLSLLIFVRKPEDIVIYAIIINLTVVFNNLVSFAYAKKEIKFDFSELEIKKYIKPLIIIVIISNVEFLFAQLDRVMLGNYVDNVSVSIYYLAYYLMTTLMAVPSSITNVSLPRLSYVLNTQGKEEYLLLFKKAVSALFFITIPMCIGVAVLAPEVMYLYGGEKYMMVTSCLVLAAIFRITFCIESVINNLVMYPNNKEKILLKILFLFGFFNLLVNFLLIKLEIFTPFLAMLTTGILELLLGLYEYYYVRKKMDLKIEIFTKENFLYLILSLCFIPIAILVKSFNLGLILNILIIVIICMSFYFGILFLKKDKNLYLILNKLLTKIRRKELK